MINFVRMRSTSLSMVVLVLIGILLLQAEISYSTTFGRLERFIKIPAVEQGALPTAWLVARGIAVLLVIALWIANRQEELFKAIVVANSLLTLGLLLNMSALVAVLTGLSLQAAQALLVDVILLALSNILIFSIWYWIVDPPHRHTAPHPSRQDVDATAIDDLDCHPDRHRRRRDQYPGGKRLSGQWF